MALLVNKFIVPKGLWKRFLCMMSAVGLEEVRARVFDKASLGVFD